VCLPVTLLPIAGKTVRSLVFESKVLEWPHGWAYCLIIPMSVAFAFSMFWSDKPRLFRPGRAFCRTLLLLNAWMYYLLNFAFFHFPWPWAPFEAWTSRSPNNLIFTVCLIGLTAGALLISPGQDPGKSRATRSI